MKRPRALSLKIRWALCAGFLLMPGVSLTQKALGDDTPQPPPGQPQSNAAPVATDDFEAPLDNSSLGPSDDDFLSGSKKAQDTKPLNPEVRNLRTARAPAKPATRSTNLNDARAAATKLRTLSAGEVPEKYAVQPGDTLWDISDQLLDDPYWWPKLWSLNPSIQNPDVIEPGMTLVFYPSDGESAPMLGLNDPGEFVLPIGFEASSLQSTNPLALSWRDKNGQLLDASEIPRDSKLIEIGNFSPVSQFLARIPGFMSRRSVENLGTIANLRSAPLMAATSQITYANFKSPPALGSRFLAVRHFDRNTDPDANFITEDMYIYSGIVGVSHLNGNGVASLLVEESLQGVSPGDILVPFRQTLTRVDAATSGRTSTAQTTVIGVLDAPVTMTGWSQILFLRNDPSLAIGDDLVIFMPPAGIAEWDSEGLDHIPVGRVRIVDLNSDSAVAVVLSSNREISVGARTWSKDLDL